MELGNQLKKVIKLNLSRHPLSTLEDYLKIEKSFFFENVYELEFFFDAQKNYLDCYESKRGWARLHYNYINKELHICNIDIYGKYLGQGYGKLFVQRLEDIAIQLGASRIVAKNSRNDTFWEHMGYFKMENGYLTDYGRELFF